MKDDRTISAKDAQRRFGKLLLMAMRLPVTIEKHGEPVAVVLSQEEYDRLQQLDDAYWVSEAEKAKKTGFIGKKKSEQLLDDLLNA